MKFAQTLAIATFLVAGQSCFGQALYYGGQAIPPWQAFGGGGYYPAYGYPSYGYGFNSSSAPYRVVYGGFGVDNLGLRNRVSPYGSDVSPYSWRNDLATQAPKIYDSTGTYRGRLSTNELDPDSISNPLGRYGSEISPESINNPLSFGTEELYVVPDGP